MKVALIGAELEENLGLRYMASCLEADKHEVNIIQFNNYYDITKTTEQIINFSPEIAGLSMVFTSRAKEFCILADKLRDSGFKGHIIAGGPFAAFNSKQLLNDYASLDSIGLSEGEKIICNLTKNLNDLSKIAGICYRSSDGNIIQTSPDCNNDDIDKLPFPKRINFHNYFGLSIASIITSRGCWRNCIFCSINAWYKQSGKKMFRIRSIENIVDEMKQLYFTHGVRIFNFQDDNFYLQSSSKSLDRFRQLQYNLQKEGINDIAIAIKARPDSITEESIAILHEIGLFRVFLGVENASENGLKHLNRRCNIDQILNALTILNNFDIHVAYNILLFEPDTTINDIYINLRFMEKHINNPQNFCRAEAHAGTGLETKLKAEGKLLGNYFGLDYRLNDSRAEIFHQIANYAFMDRNFNNSGLHYFNMQVDFYYHLLLRFYPAALNQTIRSYVRNFIKRTNMETYQLLSYIYDYVSKLEILKSNDIQNFTLEMRAEVDKNSRELRKVGEDIIELLESIFKNRDLGNKYIQSWISNNRRTFNSLPGSFDSVKYNEHNDTIGILDVLNMVSQPIPYNDFKKQLSENK